MMGKDINKQQRLMIINLEEMIPEEHLLRAITKAVDFHFIHQKVEKLYALLGRKSIDPVVLIKMLLIGYLYGIPSERKLEEEVRLNIAYRWFLGMDLADKVPDHSTFSQNRRRRFNDSSVFQEIFDHIVGLCIEHGLVTGEVLVADSTHIKANASMKNAVKVTVTKTTSQYLAQLEEEASRYESKTNRQDENRRGRKPNQEPPKKEETRSLTDPDARMMSRPGKPRGFHYLSHTSIDPQYGIITDIHVTPGNVNDQEPIVERLKQQQTKYRFQIRKFGADKGYDFAQVHHGLAGLEIEGYIPSYKRKTDSDVFGVEQFSYDRSSDSYRCPNGKPLRFTHFNRQTKSIARIYASKAKDCRNCQAREGCFGTKMKTRIISRPIFQDSIEANQRRVFTDEYFRVQRLRRIWCEGTFGILKREHNLQKTFKRGIERVQEHCLMAALALNIKRMVRAMS